MIFKKNKIEFESDKVKVYVQQLQAENALLRQANEEKNELLIKLGYPTKATARRKVFTLEQQLKRKEQECEELKKTINEAKNSKLDLNSFFAIEATVGEYQLELDQLKAENKILKEKFEIAIKNNMDKTLLRLEKGDVQEELQEIREQFGIETLYCHVDNTRVHRCLDVLRLKDVLTEIKEIAEKNLNIHTCAFTGCGYDLITKQILQKISECEVE